ncbi:cyclin N-terminal domain-containing protein 1 isoform 1-T1 [Synchiropus picturatus]
MASSSQMMISGISAELLTDFLVDLSEKNKDNLQNAPKWAGVFRERAVIEPILLITKHLGLNPEAGYHAIEILRRFMSNRITNVLIQDQDPTIPEQSLDQKIVIILDEHFPLSVVACVQIASKLWSHFKLVDLNTAVTYLHSVGHTVTKKAVLDLELMVLKELDFRLQIPTPVTYVDALLEALGYNLPAFPADQLRHLCCDVLLCFTYQRTKIYETLLMVMAECPTPSDSQREMFMEVSEDSMLLAVGVIAVGAYIHDVGTWEKVVGELRNITGISRISIFKFSHVILMHALADYPNAT